MERMAVGLAVVFEFQAGHAKAHDRGGLCPALIELDKRFQDAIEIFRVVSGRDDEIPRLTVIRRRSPARRLEKAAKLLRLDRAAIERPRAPPFAQQFVNRYGS